MKNIKLLILLFGFLFVSLASADYPPNPQDCCVYCPDEEQELCFWNDSNFLYMSVDPDSVGSFCGGNDLTVIQDATQYSTVRGFDEMDEYLCGDVYIYIETRLAESSYDLSSPFDPTSPMTIIIEDCIDYNENVSLEYPSGCGVVATTTLPITTTTTTIQITTTTIPVITTTTIPVATTTTAPPETTTTVKDCTYGSCITTVECTEAFGFGWGCLSGCCEKVPNTTTTTTASSCPSEQFYGEQSEETELLRYFRDNILAQSPAGQEIIKLYYQWSPAIAEMMEADESFKADLKELIDGVLEMIGGDN